MRRARSSACVLLSGGLDSGVLFCHYLERSSCVQPLYVRCGFRWEEAELHWLKRFLRAVGTPRTYPLRVLFLPMRSLYPAHWSLTGKGTPGALTGDAAVYLPGRNLFLLSAAAVICAEKRLKRIALGILEANPFGDATPLFFRNLTEALTQALRFPIRIETPFRNLNKAQLVRRSSGVPLGLTFSCLRPQKRYFHCGKCNKCAERKRAFGLAGIADPTCYG